MCQPMCCDDVVILELSTHYSLIVESAAQVSTEADLSARVDARHESSYGKDVIRAPCLEANWTL